MSEPPRPSDPERPQRPGPGGPRFPRWWHTVTCRDILGREKTIHVIVMIDHGSPNPIIVSVPAGELAYLNLAEAAQLSELLREAIAQTRQ